MIRESVRSRLETVACTVIVISALVLVGLWFSGCAPVPKPLSPEAQIAFQATRVVKVLDVVRDAAIAANDVVPPAMSTESTRKVVLWHKSAVQIVMAVPSGWQSTVKSTIYVLTCHPAAVPTPPPSSACVPQLAPSEVGRLYPYIGLALVVIEEIK